MSTAAPLQHAVAVKPKSLAAQNRGLLLQRKCACGCSTSSLTEGCEECKRGLQTKLATGPSNDQLEEEADRVADQVSAGPGSFAGNGAPPLIHRRTGQLMASTETAPASVEQILASPGRALEPVVRRNMEQRLGHDFSRVRLHTDIAAEQSANDVHANAYTVGRDIVFARGRFSPATDDGQRLITHELTHVVQQEQGLHAARQTGKLVAQRQPRRTRKTPSKEAGKSAPTPTPRVNDVVLLSAIDLEHLAHIYAAVKAEAALRRIGITTIFTPAWIEGAGRKAIQEEITKRLAAASQSEHIALLAQIDSMHSSEFDSSRIAWLRDQVNAGLPLTREQRVELRRVAGDRMNAAYTDFSGAAEANARSLKAAVLAEATVLSVVFDVFMGFAAPGLARGIGALASRLPVNASNLSYRVALQGLDERQTERLFAAATKVGKEAIKAHANALFGETDTDNFIRNLKGAFRQGTSKVNDDLPNRTDEELGVIAATYDPEVSDEAHYIPIIKDLVSRFQRQVLPIGPPKTKGSDGDLGPRIYTTTQDGLAWVQVADVEYLVRFSKINNHFFFGTFVDSDLADAAIARAGKLQPGGLPMLSSNAISGFPSTIPANVARRASGIRRTR